MSLAVKVTQAKIWSVWGSSKELLIYRNNSPLVSIAELEEVIPLSWASVFLSSK